MAFVSNKKILQSVEQMIKHKKAIHKMHIITILIFCMQLSDVFFFSHYTETGCDHHQWRTGCLMNNLVIYCSSDVDSVESFVPVLATATIYTVVSASLLTKAGSFLQKNKKQTKNTHQPTSIINHLSCEMIRLSVTSLLTQYKKKWGELLFFHSSPLPQGRENLSKLLLCSGEHGQQRPFLQITDEVVYNSPVLVLK